MCSNRVPNSAIRDAAVSKAVRGHWPLEGSNPSPSARDSGTVASGDTPSERTISTFLMLHTPGTSPPSAFAIDGERADTAGGSVDENGLSGLEPCVIAQSLERAVTAATGTAAASSWVVSRSTAPIRTVCR